MGFVVVEMLFIGVRVGGIRLGIMGGRDMFFGGSLRVSHLIGAKSLLKPNTLS